MTTTLALPVAGKILGIAVALTGWGYLAARALDRAGGLQSSLSSSLRFFELGIVGFGGAYLYAVAASLVAPLSGTADWIFTGVGAGGFAWMIGSRMRRRPWHWGGSLWAAGLVAFVAYGTVLTPLNYDAGLYYLQAVQYFERGPLPLGIVNVHARLGFNSAWFPLSALCSGSVFGTDGLFLLNAAAVLIFLGAMMAHALEGHRRGRFGISAACAAAATALFLWDAGGVLFSWFGLSPSGDLPAALSCCYAAVALLALAENVRKPDSASDAARWFHLLVVAATLSVIVKVSQAPVGLLLLLALFPVGVYRFLGGLKSAFGAAVGFGGLLSIGWITHGIMTSGCVVFPVAGSCLGFLPWTTEPAKAEWIEVLIRSWAKVPGVAPAAVPGGFDWLPLWRARMLPNREFIWTLGQGAGVLLAVAAILLVSGWIATGSKNKREEVLKPALLALAVLCGGVVFWFIDAPDPRLGLGFLIGAPALFFALLVGVGLQSRTTDRPVRFLAGILAALVLWAGVRGAIHLRRERGAVAELAWKQLPTPRLRSIVTAGGVKVRLPLNGDQCWNAPAPCTPEMVSGLRQTTFLGRTEYSHGNPQDRGAVEIKVETAPGESPFPVIFGPAVWGEERAARAGKMYRVRWLQNETGFAVENGTGKDQEVVLSVDVATFAQSRHLSLVANGRKLTEQFEITQEFWSQGSQPVRFPVSLAAGKNQFSLTTGEPAGMLPGNRPACLLLVGDIRVEVRN